MKGYFIFIYATPVNKQYSQKHILYNNIITLIISLKQKYSFYYIPIKHSCVSFIEPLCGYHYIIPRHCIHSQYFHTLQRYEKCVNSFSQYIFPHFISFTFPVHTRLTICLVELSRSFLYLQQNRKYDEHDLFKCLNTIYYSCVLTY